MPVPPNTFVGQDELPKWRRKLQRTSLERSLPFLVCIALAFNGSLIVEAKEYKQEVNEAGKNIWVVLFLYKSE